MKPLQTEADLRREIKKINYEIEKLRAELNRLADELQFIEYKIYRLNKEFGY